MQIIFSSGGWFGEQRRCDSKIIDNCLGDYNESLLDPTANAFNRILKLLVILSLVLSILCYKWKGIALYFYYLEMLTRLIAVAIPNIAGYKSDEVKLLAVHSSLFICYYTDSRL